MSSQRKHNMSPSAPTVMTLYTNIPEGIGCEIFFNKLRMSPSPSREHQLILIKLTTLLFRFLEEKKTGILFSAPFDVHLVIETDLHVLQPDLFVILNQNQQIIKKNGVHGVPSLIIEILSTNRKYDTKRKKSLYEKAGVKEYFMIDPDDKTTTLLTLNDTGVYELTYEDIGSFRSNILSCIISF